MACDVSNEMVEIAKANLPKLRNLPILKKKLIEIYSGKSKKEMTLNF